MYQIDENILYPTANCILFIEQLYYILLTDQRFILPEKLRLSCSFSGLHSLDPIKGRYFYELLN